MARSPATCLALVAFLAPCAACLSAEGIAHRAVPATLEAGVGFLEDPESQRRLVNLLADPQIKQAARELTESLAGGVVDGAVNDARQARLHRASAAFVDQVTRAASAGLRRDLAPALAHLAQVSAERALLGALSPSTRQEAVVFVDAILHGAAGALADDLRSDLGPALRDVLLDDMMPVVSVASREAARQIVLGAADGFRELNAEGRLSAYEDTLWARLNSLLHTGMRLSQILAWVLGLAALGLALLFGRAIYVRRKIEEERRRSERLLHVVLGELRHGAGKPEIEALLAQLRQRNPELADDAFFDALARRVEEAAPARARRPR